MKPDHDDAVPDHDTPAGKPVRNINAPDLGGSFEESGQVRHHDGIGAAPGLQPVVKLESQKAAEKVEDQSSSGS
jgi:hypothetical protein